MHVSLMNLTVLSVFTTIVNLYYIIENIDYWILKKCIQIKGGNELNVNLLFLGFFLFNCFKYLIEPLFNFLVN